MVLWLDIRGLLVVLLLLLVVVPVLMVIGLFSPCIPLDPWGVLLTPHRGTEVDVG